MYGTRASLMSSNPAGAIKFSHSASTPASHDPELGASTVSLGEHVWSMNLAPGQITRQFLTVPHGAAWIDVAVTGGNTYGGGDNGTNPRLYALHLQQVSDDDAQ